MTQKGNRLGEYQSPDVQKTLDSASFAPPLINDARKAQDRILRKRFLGKRIRIADIGCGDGRHATMFGPTCATYHGYEISADMVRMAQNTIADADLPNVKVVLGDAAQVDLTDRCFDTVWCLYFTAGNLRDEFDDLVLYTDAYLDRNPKFIKTMSRFFERLALGGTMLLTVYKDVPEAESAQLEFYDRTGQKVLTPRGSRFVATDKNFWSVRWTEQSLLSNLMVCGVREDAIGYHSLNEIAWLVEVRKER